MSTCNPLWKLLIARFGFVELCAAGRHEIKISKVLRLIRTREGKKVDLQDFSFVAKSGGVCASRRGARPPVTFYLFAAATKFNLQPIQPQGLTSKTIIVQKCDNSLELEQLRSIACLQLEDLSVFILPLCLSAFRKYVLPLCRPCHPGQGSPFLKCVVSRWAFGGGVVKASQDCLEHFFPCSPV